MNIQPVSAILFMKGHSSRIPGKNTKIFAGKPICFYILETLSESKYVKQIIVDTDSKEIANLVSGAFPHIDLIDRPESLRGSKVPATPLIEYDLKFSKNSHFIQNHVTTPILSTATIDRAIETYFIKLDEGFDSVMGVNRHQSRFYRADGTPINHNPDIMLPSQDMQPIFEDNSNFYINSLANFYDRKNRVGKKPFFFEVSKIECLDIDEQEDFIIAEAVYKSHKGFNQ